MKAKLLTVLLAAAAAIGSPFAHASDGTITFKGQITDTTCTITTGNAGSFTVTLPNVSKTNLTTAGSTAGTTGFSIALSNCNPASGNVHAFFEAGANVDPATGRLINTDDVGSGGAANVQIGLLNPSNGSLISIGASDGAAQNSLAQPIKPDGTALLPYAAQYVATGGAAAAGSVSSSVTYILSYQ
ncbi:Major fimbrial subunit SMF-1 [Cupriavidus laharis]|uniref:Major fimbrial subunit SMF-1 n=1 Tax=Cupriavidus laharis TaxID=151654 RepID=A0ABM8XW25_9BURK|nr:fimbrial protein [Cupriavidus laharis]CAG9184554.1 Major fimbrial subunit SMF-1 [Cupriavidus laharis]